MKRYPVHRSRGLPDWSIAVPLTDFSFPWEKTRPPRTELKALWDTERLHFRFACVDSDLVLADAPTAKERVLGSDRVEIFLAPSLELNPYFCLEMEPRGDVYAYRARTYRQLEDDFECAGLVVTASIAAPGYVVEASLPLATLRSLGVLDAHERELYVGVYRAEFSHRSDGTIHRGWMPWVDPQTPTPDFHVKSSFGIFELRD